MSDNGTVNRVSVIGSSGSGKTTVARSLAIAIDVPYLELDSVFHRPGWAHPTDDEFRETVATFVTADRWVVDGNYTSHGVADLVWPRADTVVWLDLPRRTVMRQVVGRTLRRVITREELWNGNKEPWTNLYSLDPEKNIIVWAWTRHGPTRGKYEARLADETWAHATVHRLTDKQEIGQFLAEAGVPG